MMAATRSTSSASDASFVGSEEGNENQTHLTMSQHNDSSDASIGVRTPFREHNKNSFLNSSSPSSIPVHKRTSLNKTSSLAQKFKLTNDDNPLSWMADEDLDEEWISESSKGTDATLEGDDSQMGTTRHVEDEKAQTPEWKRALKQDEDRNRNNEHALQRLFNPPTVKESDKLDAIPENSESSFANSQSFETSESVDDSRRLSSSPLKVFQQHDTFTNSRYDGLLGSLDRRSADQSQNSVVPGDVNDINNNNNKREVTTQDYMNDADELMAKLRGMKQPQEKGKGEDGEEDDDEPTFQHNDETEYTQESNDDDSSLRELEYSIKQHQPEPKLNTNPNPPRNRPALIQPKDVQHVIPNKFGAMDFDQENYRWKRKMESDFGTGSTKVGSDPLLRDSNRGGEEDEKDVFEGIDDLSDGSTLENERHDRMKESQNSDEEERSLDEQPTELRSEDQASQNSDEVESIESSEEEEVEVEEVKVEQRDKFDQEGGFAPFRTPLQPKNSRLTPGSSNRREVSFRLPKSSMKTSPMGQFFENSVRSLRDVTNISQVDASYSQGYSALVRILTDMGRNDPAWDQYDHLDLSNKGLETLVKLDEICPALKSINLADNEISFVSGAPETLRSMIAPRNQLTELASFGKLINLEYLSLSDNRYERLNGLAGLCHLRELNVDNNFVSTLDGISNLEGLLRLSCSGNMLTDLDFSGYKWRRLEELVLDGNKISTVKGFELLPSLSKLNLDNNQIERFEYNGKHKRIRKLSLNRNKLKHLDVAGLVGLRELHLDDNPGGLDLHGVERLKNLETLSLRYGSEANDWTEFSEVRQLAVSGTVINQPLPMDEPFLNLQSLELSSCRLVKLPPLFSEYTINIRELNLSLNKLTSLKPLVGIPKLKRLYLYKNEITDLEHVIDTVATFDELTVLDLRGNPITSRFYPQVVNPTLARAASDYVATRSRKFQQSWQLKDGDFLQKMPDRLQQKRLKYQALIWGASTVCGNGRLQWLDGIMLDKPKRAQLQQELGRVMSSY